MTETDERSLSAFLDGALAESDMASLRARLEAEPELAERLADLAMVDSEIGVLANAPVSDARLAALRSRLDARLGELSPLPASRGRQPTTLIAAAAVLAAGLTLYLVSGVDPVSRSAGDGADGFAAIDAANIDAADDVAPSAPGIVRASTDVSDGLDEMELAVAFEYEVLADLDVIENLALLEALAARDALEQM